MSKVEAREYETLLTQLAASIWAGMLAANATRTADPDQNYACSPYDMEDAISHAADLIDLVRQHVKA